MEGEHLPAALAAAVPIWIAEFETLSDEERARLVADLNKSELSRRLEYVLHRGPKAGDSARAFNDLAKSIALLAFAPGGVRCFGSHWQAETGSAGAVDKT